jgi:hypothetical protein
VGVSKQVSSENIAGILYLSGGCDCMLCARGYLVPPTAVLVSMEGSLSISSFCRLFPVYFLSFSL